MKMVFRNKIAIFALSNDPDSRIHSGTDINVKKKT